jgi:hypothetical protein
MAAGTGIASQVGIAPEATFGTYVAPTKFLRVNKSSIKPKFGRYDAAWIGVGPIQLDSSSVRTTREAAGPIEVDIVNKGFGLLLQSLMGTTVTPVQQASTTAYLQTHTLAATTDGKTLSIQHGVPDVTGTVRPYTFVGSKVTGATCVLSADYVDKTIFVDRFMGNTSFSLVIEAIGLNIQSTYYDTFRITLPCCRFDGDLPILDNNDVVNGDFPFTYRFDGTNQAKIEYISTDTTV